MRLTTLVATSFMLATAISCGGDTTSPLPIDEIHRFFPDHHIALGSDALLGGYGTVSTDASGQYQFTRQSSGEFKTVEQYTAVNAVISTFDSTLNSATAKLKLGASLAQAKVSADSFRLTSIQVQDPLALITALKARMAENPSIATVLIRPDARVITGVAYFLGTASTKSGTNVSLVNTNGFQVSFGNNTTQTIRLADNVMVAYRTSLLCWTTSGTLQQIEHDRPGTTSTCPAPLTNAPNVIRTIQANNWPTLVTVGQASAFGVTVRQPDGTVAPNPRVEWSVTDGSIAIPDTSHSAIARVTGVRSGSTFVTATLPADGIYPAVSLQRQISVAPDPCVSKPLSSGSVTGSISSSSCSLGPNMFGDNYALTVPVQQLYDLYLSLINTNASLAGDTRILVKDASGEVVAESSHPESVDNKLVLMIAHVLLAPGSYTVVAMPTALISPVPYRLDLIAGSMAFAACYGIWITPGATFTGYRAGYCPWGTGTYKQAVSYTAPANYTTRVTYDGSKFGTNSWHVDAYDLPGHVGTIYSASSGGDATKGPVWFEVRTAVPAQKDLEFVYAATPVGNAPPPLDSPSFTVTLTRTRP